MLLPLFFALLLVVTQQEMAAHAYSHAMHEQQTSQHDKQAPHSSNCAKCVMYAGMAGAIGAKSQAAQVLAAQPAPWAAVLPSYISATLLPYHSRAPPLLA
jgi:hypothetical protein